MQEAQPHPDNVNRQEENSKDYVIADRIIQSKHVEFEPVCTVSAEKLFKDNLIKCKTHLHLVEDLENEVSDLEILSEPEEEEEEIEEEKEEDKDKKEKPKKKSSAQHVLEWMEKKNFMNHQIIETQSIVISSNGKMGFFATKGNPNIFCYNLEQKKLKCNTTK